MERHVGKSQASDKLSYSANVILFYIDLGIIMTSYDLYIFYYRIVCALFYNKYKL